MSSDVQVIANKTYFNMNKFEYIISNRGIQRQKMIELRKRNRLIDCIIIAMTVILFAFTLCMATVLAYKCVVYMGKNHEANKLQLTLAEKKASNESEIKLLKNDLQYDNIRKKAFLEFNMITPTDENIIYFDKGNEIFR